MALKYYDSPFHVTYDDETASKMAMKVDLSIMLSKLIKDRGLTQAQAAELMGIKQSRVSNLTKAKVEKFTVDSMLDMLDALGFRAKWSMPSLKKATITITETRTAVAATA